MGKIIKKVPRKTIKVPILLLEDNADQWLIMRAALAKCFPEVAPVWVNNSAQAIVYLETHSGSATKSPILVISDLYLPLREDGLAILRFIKNHNFYRKPPVVVISSSQAKEDIDLVYAYSAASYIIKPTSYHEWLTCFYTFRLYWWEIVSLPIDI